MSRIQADFLLAVVAVIWGSAFVSQSLGMASVGPYAFTGARFLLGALIVFPLAWRELHVRGKSEHIEPLDRYDLKLILALGTLLFLGAVFQQIGIMSTTVTNAGFLTALYVPLVPLFSWLLFKQLPHWAVWPASAGCVSGTWLLTGGELISLNAGDAWVIASSFFWAGHVLLIGHSATHRAGPFTVACGQFLVVGVLGSVAAVITEPLSVEVLKSAAGTIAYAGILSVGFGFTGQVIAQRHTPAADTAIILSLETAFAAIFGALWLGERLDSMGLIGCSLIFVSILAVQLLPLIRSQKR
jgi:drug/metabolite transporter (DMT)-like permease